MNKLNLKLLLIFILNILFFLLIAISLPWIVFYILIFASIASWSIYAYYRRLPIIYIFLALYFLFLLEFGKFVFIDNPRSFYCLSVVATSRQEENLANMPSSDAKLFYQRQERAIRQCEQHFTFSDYVSSLEDNFSHWTPRHLFWFVGNP